MAKQTKKSKAEADKTFLDKLDGREFPSLARARGTIRFDLAGNGRTDHVRVELDGGRISVSRKVGAADCVVRTDRALFDDLAKGKANPLTALLRGVLTYEGDAELLVLFRRAIDEAATA